MESIVSRIFNYTGMVGSGVSGYLVPPNRVDSVEQERTFRETGEVQNPDVWDAFNNVMRTPRSYEESLRIWDEMSAWDLVSAALTETVEESTSVDPSSPGLLWYECADAKLEDSLNEMVQEIGVDDKGPSQFWHLAGFGNNFEYIEAEPGRGVLGMSFIHPMDIRRYWLKRTRKCVGYRWFGHKPPKEYLFDLPNGQKAQRPQCPGTSSNTDMEQLWYPWEIMHMRRMHRTRQSEHGQPLFEDAIGIYKKMRMALDQMVVYRMQMQPDRYVVNIDVKDQPPADQMRTVQRWKQTLRSQLAFNGQGFDSNLFGEMMQRYNTMSLDTILWVAKPRDFQHTIEKLAGTAAVPDVYDIELLTNLFFSIIGMPKSWIGLQKGAEQPMSGKALLAQDMRFLRKIKSLRRAFMDSYRWLGYYHLMLQGHDVDSIDLQVQMPPIGSLDDQMRLEVLDKQVNVMDRLGDLMQKFELPREAWIDVVFKRYMNLPDEVVASLLTALPPDTAPMEGQLPKNRKSPHMKALLEDVIAKMGPSSNHRRAIMDLMSGRSPRQKVFRWKKVNIANQPNLLAEDLIISSFGSDADPTQAPPASVSENLRHNMRPPGYRAVMDAHLRG